MMAFFLFHEGFLGKGFDFVTFPNILRDLYSSIELPAIFFQKSKRTSRRSHA